MCELQKMSQPHNAHCLKYFVLLFKENYSCWVDYWLTGYHLKMLNFFIQSQINFKAISFCFLLKPQKILKWFFSENYLINFVLLCLQFYDYYYMHLLNPQLSKRWKEMPDAGLSKEYNADMVWNPKDTALIWGPNMHQKKDINEKVNQVYVACINHIGNCLLSTTMKHDYSNYLLIE